MNSISHLKLDSIFQVADGYKLSHWNALPNGTTEVFSNLTARTSRIPSINHVMVFGIQYAVKEIESMFKELFFDKRTNIVVQEYKDWWKEYFGTEALEENCERVRNLHKLGYLPLEILALDEGTYCPIGVPFVVFRNTHPDFPWVTNFVETMFSALVWDLVTVATISAEYKKNFVKFANLTSDNLFMTDFQGHDFSMRGQRGVATAATSGMAWLLNSKGSDSMPSIAAIKKYYGVREGTLVLTSVPASEHSLQCAYLFDTDDTSVSDRNYVRAMLETYPTGIVSVVSDGFDFWRLVTQTLPELKQEIMLRDGKLVVRPDSSPKTPVEIIIGDPEAETEWERKGLIEVLWDIFGGTVNSKGYKVLDSHIGAIYGDSITLEYQVKILQGLMDKGFDTTNIVLGVGSYSLQYITRDTFGMAIKATCMVIDGKVVPIYKDPKTDNGTKKSARGYLDVTKNDDGEYVLIQNIEDANELFGAGSHLFTVFEDGYSIAENDWEYVTRIAKISIEQSLAKA